MRYRKRPLIVEAVQWTGDNLPELQEWGVKCYEVPAAERDRPEQTLTLWVEANRSWLPLVTGEWVLRDSAGFYPCKRDVFEATYEIVDEQFGESVVIPATSEIVRQLGDWSQPVRMRLTRRDDGAYDMLVQTHTCEEKP